MSDSVLYDLIATDTGQVLKVHHSSRCAVKYNQSCPIHAPSDHHMKTWPQHWNTQTANMERVCEHNIAHHDPDDYNARARGILHLECDGCCIPPGNGTEEIK